MTEPDAGKLEGFLEDLCALLAIPSVAVWRDRGDALEQAATWLKGRLARAGLSSQLLVGSGYAPPYVYAEGKQRPDRPTFLVYGHYDVQPARRADGWSTDPFQPELRDGRLYARGATDQKMNLLLPIAALEELSPDEATCNVKILFEGEEEIFSPHLAEILERHADLLACDLCISSDGWQSSPDTGDLRLGLRGFCGLEVRLSRRGKDLHSGTFGGAVPNPAAGLIRLLADLWDANGNIALPGFHDGIIAATDEERDVAIAAFDEGAWRARAGLPEQCRLATAGAAVPVRVGLEPAIEVNALDSGDFAGGMRTVVPASAAARLSCRLVPGQDPVRIRALLEEWLRRRVPPGCEIEVTPLPGTARAYRINADHPGQRLASRILGEVDGREPVFSFSGGSIPMPGEIEHALGVKTVIFGFGLPDENMHGADEFCRLTDIDRGLAAWRRFWRIAGDLDAISIAGS